LGMPKTLDETLVTGLVWGWGTARWDRGAYIVAVHAELPSELHPEIIQLFRAEAAHLSRASPLLDSGGDRSELAVSRFLGMSFEMLTGPSPTPRTHILARIAAGSGTHDVAMMKASPKKTMAAYVADGEVERRAPPPRPTTATGGSRGGLGAFAHRPGSAPSSAGASPIKGAHAARRVHPSALASPVRATAAGAAASKKANDQRRREEGRRSINERTASTRAGVKAKVVTRHAPPTQAQSHAVTTLWDKISGACDNVTQALEECAKAMVEPDPNRGTPGFGNSSSNSTSAPGVSGTTRRKNASRASLKLREAKSQFNSFTGGFDELRRHSAALAAALHRSETSAGTVTEQLASTAGYAEETTNRLRTTAREKEVAEMTAKQAKSALQDALARIEVLEKERRLVYFFFIFLVTRVGN